MKYPVVYYFKEIKWKIYYLILSIFLCMNIFFYYSQNLLLCNFFPILIYTQKRFISFNVTELFFILISLLFYLIFVSIVNSIRYHIIFFLCPSWHKLQSYIFKKISFMLWIAFCLLVLFTHFYILPKLFSFFAFWEMKQKYFLLHIELEAHVQNYVYWILKTNFVFVTSQLILVFIFINTLLFFELVSIYLNIKKRKKYFIFIIFIIFSFFLNLDPIFLLFSLFFIFSIIELCLFFLLILVALQIE